MTHGQTHGRNLREAGARIETLLTEVRARADGPVLDMTEELVRLLAEVYGAGLERILEIVDEGPGGAEVIARLADDELVASLLLLHDLHPIDVETRIEVALDKVRPYLGSHAGGVDFLGVDDDGVVRLRLEGSCNGCPSSTVTVKLAIERAIEEAAPEVTGIAVEGVVAPPKGPVISLDALRRDGTASTNGNGSHADHVSLTPTGGEWVIVDGLAGLDGGMVAPVQVDGVPVVVCRLDDDLLAYRNRCPVCGGIWADERLNGKVLACGGCGERYDVRLAGSGLNGRKVRLEPLPLLAQDGVVRIAIAGYGA